MVNYKVTAFDMKVALMQYYRFKRGWICVYEFHGADIIVDTDKEIIEIETKVTKHDLIKGEMKKLSKHQRYKNGIGWAYLRPNKFSFCVPENLVETALAWAKKINEDYGVIAFETERFKEHLLNNKLHWLAWNCYLRTVRSAKKLHTDYKDTARWRIAKRTSSALANLMEYTHTKNLQEALSKSQR